ncbi:MAG: BON domain-containing protein [Rubrivivax sp.]
MKPVLKRTFATACAGLAAAALLSACDRVAEPTAGRTPSSTTAEAPNPNPTAARIESKTEAAGERMGEATRDATAAVRSGVDTAGDKVKDAAITTAVNAQLAADSALSALNIDVDTSNGSVILRGTAPDATAKDHATTLAKSIDGVTKVDNQLVIASK